MIASANAVGRKDYGYQRSGALIEAGRKYNLAKGTLSCIRNKTTLTEAVIRLAELTNTELEQLESLTYAEARASLHKAREELKTVQKEDGEHRIKWLESLAHDNWMENPIGSFESFLKQMINAAKNL